MIKVKAGLWEEHAYYLNSITGESKWEKSPLLKTWDLPTQPSYRWVQLWYSQDQPLYVNPLTGRYTHLSVNRAAKVIQDVARCWFMRTYKMPVSEFVKCVTFDRTARPKFEKDPEKLSCIANYAIYNFVIKRDEKLGRIMLNKALDLADTNPLVTRVLAVYLLSTCEAPLMSSREKATTLFRDAELRDPDRKKFDMAHNCFKYACIRKPKDAHSVLNLAIVEYFVYQNLGASETLFRRAVSMMPFDERIFQNWKFMRDFFPERKQVFRPRNQIEMLKASGVSANSKAKYMHSREVREDPAWAGWVYALSGAQTIDEKESKEYWYNPATGEETLKIPDFAHEWQVRLYRSHYESTKDGLEHYYDPLTACYFQRHVLTDTFS
jgi:hypothetical protein